MFKKQKRIAIQKITESSASNRIQTLLYHTAKIIGTMINPLRRDIADIKFYISAIHEINCKKVRSEKHRMDEEIAQ